MVQTGNIGHAAGARSASRLTSGRRLVREGGAGYRGDAIDPVALSHGAWNCFCILLLGGLAVAGIAPGGQQLRDVLLVVTAVAAFAAAGARIGDAGRPAVHGLAAATTGYLILLPLTMMLSATPTLGQVGVLLATATVIGAASGHYRGRLRRPVGAVPGGDA